MSIRDELIAIFGRRVWATRGGDFGDIADEILARFAVVELPEPTGTESDTDERIIYWAGPEAPYGCSVVESTGLVSGIAIDFPEWVTDPDTARGLAAALLAAANRAGGQS